MIRSLLTELHSTKKTKKHDYKFKSFSGKRMWAPQ